ncbi:hypothetical protein ACFQX4_24745 [Roseomonas sp. GCM10028921]
MLDEGRCTSITEMAEAERLDRGYMGRLLQLTLLAPGIIQAILDGRPVPELTLATLSNPLFPASSEQQRALFGRDLAHRRT